MALMSLRINSRVKESTVLTIADNLCIHNYIRSFLNIILKHILMAQGGDLESNHRPTACVSDAIAY